MLTDNRIAAIALSLSLGLHVALISSTGGYSNIFKRNIKPMQIKAIEFDEKKYPLLPEIKIIGEFKNLKSEGQDPDKAKNPDTETAGLETDYRYEEKAVTADTEADEAMLRYQDSVKQKIQAGRYYPERARRMQVEGIVGLQFKILASGASENIQVVQSSGAELLDSEAVRTIQKASPFLPLPKTIARDEVDIRVAIVFSLR